MRKLTQAGWIVVQIVVFVAMMTAALSIPAPDTPKPGVALIFSVFAAYLVTFLCILAVEAVTEVRRWLIRRRHRPSV